MTTSQRHFKLDKDQKHDLRYNTFRGWEIVEDAARLCVMNLYLQGIGGEESLVVVDDSLRSEPSDHFDMVLINPPFDKKKLDNQ